jgi:hypothetical protein
MLCLFGKMRQPAVRLMGYATSTTTSGIRCSDIRLNVSSVSFLLAKSTLTWRSLPWIQGIVKSG